MEKYNNRKGRLGKINCLYLEKSEIDLEGLREKLTDNDVKEIALRLKMHTVTIYSYLSDKKRLEHVKVPEVLIVAAEEVIAERKAKIASLNETINNI